MKKIIIALVFLFAPCLTFADSIVIFSTNTNNCLRFLPSRDPVNYVGRIDAMIFNDTTSQTEEQVFVLLSTTSIRYFKKSGTRQIVEMTQAEKAQVDAEAALQMRINVRAKAIEALNIISANPILMRAITDIAKDEINILRKWDRDLKVAVAASTTLAQLKTNIAALPTLNDRTLTEFKNAIIVKINSGAAD